jgi:hypothetical protein
MKRTLAPGVAMLIAAAAHGDPETAVPSSD